MTELEFGELEVGDIPADLSRLLLMKLQTQESSTIPYR